MTYYFQRFYFLRVDGVNAAEVTKKVKAHANDPTADIPPAAAPPKEDLDTKLKRLINMRKCLSFIFPKQRPAQECAHGNAISSTSSATPTPPILSATTNIHSATTK